MSAEQYVSGIGPFTYTLKDLKEMSGGKKKLAAIEFYDYYESAKTKQKGFILKDDPSKGEQSLSGGPIVEFVKTSTEIKRMKKDSDIDNTIYDSYGLLTNTTDKVKEKMKKSIFPISLDDERFENGIRIRNLSSNLGGEIDGNFTKFDAKNRSSTDPGKGKTMMIKFIFSD